MTKSKKKPCNILERRKIIKFSKKKIFLGVKKIDKKAQEKKYAEKLEAWTRIPERMERAMALAS